VFPLYVFPLYQIADVGGQSEPKPEANQPRNKLYSYIQSVTACVKNIPERHRQTEDRKTDDVAWHQHAMHSSEW